MATITSGVQTSLGSMFSVKPWIMVLLVLAAADNFDEPTSLFIPLMHSYNGVDWETRAELKLRLAGERSSSVSYQHRKFEKERLIKQGMYWVGIETERVFLKVALPVCALTSADLHDHLSLHVDFENKQILSINYSGASACTKLTTVALKPSTQVELEHTQLSPKPSFYTKPLTEAEPEPGFLRKYWWAILIGYIFLLRAGGNAPGQPAQQPAS
mmetsp:Transcript_24128/g.42832  ORF Transcript_24128/g.42832 Transcript_24128/m.42832 type:complete len:214 (+) Transcript_24128:4003-4644(+)